MPYGILKIDTITFTDGGVDKSVPVSGLVLNPTFTGNVTVTGTISGNIIQGGTTVSGLTVTGTTANFASGVFTTQVSGLLITGPTVSATTGTFTSLTGTTTNGTTASFTTGNFTSLTGTTTTGTTANFASGVFTTQVSGLLITGPTVSATTGTFTSLTGTTTTGTTANFASGVFTTQISGVTITGTTVSTTTGNFTSLTGTTATITSGIIASGTAALPSLAILSDPNTGIYSPGADQLAVATNGTGRLFVDASGSVGLGTSQNPTAGGFSRPVLFLKQFTDPAAGFGGVHIEASGDQSVLGIGYDGTAQVFAFDTSYRGTGARRPIVFKTTGAECMRIDSAGLVGIGTSSPGTSLDVRGIISLGSSNVANAVIQKSAVPIGSYNLTITAGGGLTSESATTPTDALAGAVIKLSGGSPVTDDFGGGIGYYANGHTSPNAAGTGNQHVFYTRSAVNTYTERLRISAAGLVGIGTNAPQNSLSVGSSAGGQIGLSLDWTGGGGPYAVAGLTADRFTGEIRQYAYTSFFPTFYANGSEKARIDTSGRLLVGTSTARSIATQSLAIQNEGTSFGTTGFSTCRNSNDIYGPYIHFGKTRGASVGSNTLVSSGDDLGGLIFGGGDGTDVDSQAAYILCQVDGTPGANDMPGRLVFSTTSDSASSPTEHLRITNAGYVASYCNNIAGGYVHYMSSPVGASSASYLIIGTYGATGVLTGTTSFIVSTNGNVLNTNNSYAGISDIKLKENIVDANSQWDDLKALQVRNYNFKEGQTHTQIGLVAQEVELVSPGIVSEAPDRDAEGNDLGTVTKSVNYSVLYMKAVKALQEAMERIEALESDVAQLKAQ